MRMLSTWLDVFVMLLQSPTLTAGETPMVPLFVLTPDSKAVAVHDESGT